LCFDAPLDHRYNAGRLIECADGDRDAVGRLVGQGRAAVGAEATGSGIRRLEFLRFAACPDEFRVANANERRIEAAEWFLAHAAVADGRVAQCAFDAEPDRAALASARMGLARHCYLISGFWKRRPDHLIDPRGAGCKHGETVETQGAA